MTVSTALAGELGEGDSIAVDGVCLTATAIDGDAFSADVMRETLARSTLGALAAGAAVNLELAVRAGDRLGGHVVQGHVDGVAEVAAVRDDGFARVVTIAPDDRALLAGVVEKGSITVAGVSLTVARVDDAGFDVSLIPETLARTTLGAAAIGDRVNLECDVLAKYAAARPPAAGAPPPLSSEQLGCIAVRLALYPQRWIERRVEGVQLLDDATVRLRVSVTFRLPGAGFYAADACPRDGQLVHVPLALLRKEPPRTLDVASEDGSTIAVPASERRGELATLGLTAALWAYAEQLGGDGLSERELALLAALVDAAPADARALVERAGRDRELGALLVERRELGGLAVELADSFLLLAPVVYRAGEERVLTYSHCQPLRWTSSWRNVLALAAWADMEQGLRSLRIGYGASYHLTVDAPADVRIARGRLYGRYAVGGDRAVTLRIAQDGASPAIDLHARRPSAGELAAAAGAPAIAPAPAPGADLVAAIAARRPSPARRSDVGFAEVRVRPSLASVLPLTAVAVLTAVALLLVRGRLELVDGQTISAVLLAAPIVAASALARPGGHAFAGHVLRGLRGLALLAGVCALLVAALLGLGLVERAPAPDCVPGALDDCVPRAEVPAAAQRVADVATWTAVGVAVLMLVGTLRLLARAPQTQTQRVGGARVAEPIVADVEEPRGTGVICSAGGRLAHVAEPLGPDATRDMLAGGAIARAAAALRALEPTRR